MKEPIPELQLEKPKPIEVQPESIPSPLRERDQWVVWRYVWVVDKKGNGKWSKVPFQALNGRHAKSNDPSTWTSFDNAVRAYDERHYDGIGFCLAEGDGLAGIDLDHVWNPETGEFTPDALDILQWFSSTYIEFSPSGEGLRIFCLGTPLAIGKGKKPNQWVEIYDYTSPRYLTVTGSRFLGGSKDITEQQSALDALHQRYFLVAPRQTSSTPPPRSLPLPRSGVNSSSDEEIIRRACASKQGSKFSKLLVGDSSDYPDKSDDGVDQSSADAAFCSMLAFWCRGDAGQMDRIFRSSGLMREKWDKVHGGKSGRTYGEMTIDYALEHCREYVSEPGARKREDRSHEAKKDKQEVSAGGNGGNDRGDDNGDTVPGDGRVDDRPVVVIGGDRLVTAMQQVERVMFRGDDPPFFERGGILMRIARIDQPRELQSDGVRREPGSAVMTAVSAGWMRRKMMTYCHFKRWDARAEDLVSVNLPKDYAESYVEGGEWWAPVLRALSHVPVLRENGSIHAKPGFDQKTGIYLESKENFKLPPVRKKGEIIDPLQDTAIRWAYGMFEDLFSSFNPETPADLSALITAVLTGIIKTEVGPSPGFAITSPIFGSGKGMLADIISIIITGNPASTFDMIEREEELQKTLFSAVLAGDRLIAIDEVKKTLNSKTLDSMLTATFKSGRVLSESKRAIVRPADSMFIILGNNLSVVQDASRRWLRICINPNCEEPHKRLFARNAIEYVKENRGKFVTAALTLLHGFFFAGKPRQGVTLGSFEKWSDTVRSCVMWAGMGDPCSTMDAWVETDERRNTMIDVMDAWLERWPDLDRPGQSLAKLTSEVCEELENEKTLLISKDFYAMLYDVCGERGKKGEGGGLNPQKLGYRLRQENKKIMGGMRFVVDSKQKRASKWKVERL